MLSALCVAIASLFAGAGLMLLRMAMAEQRLAKQR